MSTLLIVTILTSTWKRSWTTSLAAAALSVPAAGAGAGILVGSGGPGPAHPRLSLSRSTGTATVPVRVSGSGFGAAEKVSVFFGTARMKVTKATRAGRFGPVTVTVPVSVTPGSKYRIWARGWSSKRSVTDWLSVPADGKNWLQFHRQASQDAFDNQENELSTGDVHLLGSKWRTAPLGMVATSSPVVANGTVYATPQGYPYTNPPVVAINAATGKIAWSVPVPGAQSGPAPFTSDPTPAVSGGTLYVGSTGSGFYAFNIATRQQEWSFQADPRAGVPAAQGFTSATVAGGDVFFGASNGLYYALNATTGRLVWYVEAGARELPPAVANGVAYLAEGGVLLAVKADGTGQVWRYANFRNIVSGPAVSGRIVYLADNSGSIVALNADTGAKLWSAILGDGGGTISAPAVANGVVYAGSTNGDLYALNATTGKQLWAYKVGAGLTGSPAIANGVVYIGANSQETVYALNAATGKKLWGYSLASTGPNGAVRSSPAVANGRLYVTAGNLFAFALK